MSQESRCSLFVQLLRRERSKAETETINLRMEINDGKVIYDGAMTLGENALFFFVPGEGAKEKLKAFIPLDRIERYGHSFDPDTNVHAVDLECCVGQSTVMTSQNNLLSPRGAAIRSMTASNERVQIRFLAGANSQLSETVVDAVVVFIDTIILRWERTCFEQAQEETAIGSSPRSKDAEDETLVFDERALRVANSVSSYHVFIPGMRFLGQWSLGLRAIKVRGDGMVLCCVSYVSCRVVSYASSSRPTRTRRRLSCAA